MPNFLTVNKVINGAVVKYNTYKTAQEASDRVTELIALGFPDAFYVEHDGNSIEWLVADVIEKTVSLNTAGRDAFNLAEAKARKILIVDNLRDQKKTLPVATEGEIVDAGTLSSGAMANELFAFDGKSMVINSITRSGSVASVTFAKNHHLDTGQMVAISGSDQIEYNGDFIITETGKKTLDFTVAGTPVSPATGTISALTKTYEWIDNLNNKVFWSATKFKAIHRDTTKYERDCVKHARDIKDDCLTSLTLAELDAIDVNTGWPETGV